MYDEFSLFCDIDSLIPANATWSKNDKHINDWNFELVIISFREKT